MYMRKVRLDQHLSFMIVVSLCLVNFKAISPPAYRECTPMRSGSIPALYRSKFCTAYWSSTLMLGGVIWVQSP
eukprot:6518827-Ditylum_brightwellii.AAC.1